MDLVAFFVVRARLDSVSTIVVDTSFLRDTSSNCILTNFRRCIHETFMDAN